MHPVLSSDISIPPVHRASLLVWTLLLGGLIVLSGCTSSRPPEERRAEQAQALGTWQYRVTGSPLLDRGSIQIEREGDRLLAILRDARRGPLRARVSVRDDRMELRIDQVVVSGRLEDDRYRATVELATWDVRGGPSVGRSSQAARRARGTLTARREGGKGRDSALNEQCRPLLRESSYVCSPLVP